MEIDNNKKGKQDNSQIHVKVKNNIHLTGVYHITCMHTGGNKTLYVYAEAKSFLYMKKSLCHREWKK